MATVTYYSRKNKDIDEFEDYKDGLSLISENDRKVIIQTLYRIKNATRTDCYSKFFKDKEIKFDFDFCEKPLRLYSNIIKSVVNINKWNNSMLAGG